MKMVLTILAGFILSCGAANARLSNPHFVSAEEVRVTEFYASCVYSKNAERSANYLNDYVERKQNRRLFLRFGEHYSNCIIDIGRGSGFDDFLIAGFLAERFLVSDAGIEALLAELERNFPPRILSDKRAIICALKSEPSDILNLFNLKPASREERNLIKSLGAKTVHCFDKKAQSAFRSIRFQPFVRASFALALFAGSRESNTYLQEDSNA